jgi:uncharacterized protein (DUF1778 family)
MKENKTPEQKATKNVSVRCKPEELEFLKQESKKRSMTLSSFLRSSAYRVIHSESKASIGE